MIACHLELGQLWRCPVTWCAVWKGSGRACLEHLAEKHGGSTLEIKTNVAQFFPPWTVTRDVWLEALRPGRIRGHRGRPSLSRGRQPIGTSIPGISVPIPTSGSSRRGYSTITFLRVSGHGYRRLTHLRLSIPSSGAPPGQVPAEYFPDAVAPVTQPLPRRVSFAEEVTTLNTEKSPEFSPMSLPLTQPVVEEMEEDTPTSEVDETQTTTPESGMPPPPGFPLFMFPEDDGGMDADEICAQFGGPTTLTCQKIGPGLPDISVETEVPEVIVPRPPSPNSLSEVIPAVGYARLPLPSVNNGVMPELVRMPALPQPTGQAVDREVVVPRWRLAREGPFMEERSADSICSLGPGCAFRNTTYRASDYAEPAGEYGLMLNHPWFIEWIGVPQSAGLLELSGRQWVNKRSRDQGVTAAVHLQRDVGLMQTNVDVLDQYALSLQKAASRIIDIFLGPLKYPASEIEMGALGPRVHRAAKQMESMGLWRPSLDPLRLH